MGVSVDTDVEYRDCIIDVDGRKLPADLVLLDMVDFDVILVMDWLAACHASVDCFQKTIVFIPVGQPSFQFQGIRARSGIRIIPALRAWKMLNKGCVGFIASLVGDGN